MPSIFSSGASSALPATASGDRCSASPESSAQPGAPPLAAPLEGWAPGGQLVSGCPADLAHLDLLLNAHGFFLSQETCVQVAKLSFAGLARLLDICVRGAAVAASAQDKQAALRRLCSHCALRLVRIVSPLHEFLEAPHHREAWCSLPLAVVEALLGHEELMVDTEETVLEAAVMWLSCNLELLMRAEQPAAAAGVLGRVHWGAVLPYALVSAWERSRGVRLFEKQTQCVHSRLIKPLPCEGQRPCASGERELVHDFEVALMSPCHLRACALGEEVLRCGLLWTVSLAPASDDGRCVAVRLQCSYSPSADVPAVPGTLTGPIISMRACLACTCPEGCGAGPEHEHAVASSLTNVAVPTAYVPDCCRVAGAITCVLDLSGVCDLAGAPLSWSTLFGPASPYAMGGTLRLLVAVAVID